MIFWRLSGGERRVGHGAPHRAPIFDRPIRTVCMILRQWECNTSPSTQPASSGGILLVLKCADFCRQLFVSLHLNMTATVPLIPLGLWLSPHFSPFGLSHIPLLACRRRLDSGIAAHISYLPLSFGLHPEVTLLSILCLIFFSDSHSSSRSTCIYKTRLAIRVVQYNNPHFPLKYLHSILSFLSQPCLDLSKLT